MLAAILIAAALVAACSAQATNESGTAPLAASPLSSASLAPTQAEAAETAHAADQTDAARAAALNDWGRTLAALAYMKNQPPSEPIVVLLGGSAARESTVSDASWRRQIKAAGGPSTMAWNMGSRNRTMAQNVAIVKNLPRDARAVVLIGINLGSFTSSQKTTSITLPSPAPTVSPTLKQPHQYSTATGILSTSKKKSLVSAWLHKRYPVYKRNFASSAGVLQTLIKLCQRRGYKPVLVELPRNTAVIGSSLRAPTKRYRNKCLALRKKYGVPWVSLVAAAKVPNRGFYDLWHLVEPGRNAWEPLLAAKTAALLTQYGYAD